MIKIKNIVYYMEKFKQDDDDDDKESVFLVISIAGHD
jgi:hypothetical protein